MVLDTIDLDLNYSNNPQDNDCSAEMRDNILSSLNFALANEDILIGGELWDC